MDRRPRRCGATIEVGLQEGGGIVGGEPVLDRDRLGMEGEGGWRKAGRGGLEGNRPGCCPSERLGAENDTVDAIFQGQCGSENVVVKSGGFNSCGWLSDAATPLGRAGKIEGDHGVGGRDTLASGIEDFDVDEGEVGAIGMQAARARVGRQADGGGRAGRAQLQRGEGLAGRVVGDSFESAGSEGNVGEGEERSRSTGRRGRLAP